MDLIAIKNNYSKIIKLASIAINYLNKVSYDDNDELKLLQINIELNRLLVIISQFNRLTLESDFKNINNKFADIEI